MPDDAAWPGGAAVLSRPPSRAREKSLAEMLSIADWRSFVPESIGSLLLVGLLGRILSSGAAGSATMPHPFWIAIILMASQHGVMGGLFATLLATAAYFGSELPEQSAGQDFYDYAATVAGQPCAWFAIALVVGGLRTLHKHHQAELQEAYDEARLIAADLASGLSRAAEEIGRLEQRIAVDTSTLASVSHHLGGLTLRDREALFASVAPLIEAVVGAASFSAYLCEGDGLRPVLAVEAGVLLPAAPGPAPQPAPEWTPIQAAVGASPIGYLHCTALRASVDAKTASRRLSDMGHLLAELFRACPEQGRG